MPNLIWVLHILPFSEKGEQLYRKVKTEIKRLGCFSSKSLSVPPFLSADEYWLDDISKINDTFPAYEDLRKMLKSTIEIKGIERVRTACKFLSVAYPTDEMIEEITAYNTV
jgi:hypothetical protein